MPAPATLSQMQAPPPVVTPLPPTVTQQVQMPTSQAEKFKQEQDLKDGMASSLGEESLLHHPHGQSAMHEGLGVMMTNAMAIPASMAMPAAPSGMLMMGTAGTSNQGGATSSTEHGSSQNTAHAANLLDMSGKSLEWMGQDWPISSSLGKSPMGTSPYGKSVDMVDMCTALMEAGGFPLGSYKNELEINDNFHSMQSSSHSMFNRNSNEGQRHHEHNTDLGDDFDEDDIMILGTTPKLDSTPDYMGQHMSQRFGGPGQKVLRSSAADDMRAPLPSESDMMGISPGMGGMGISPGMGTSPGLVNFLAQHYHVQGK